MREMKDSGIEWVGQIPKDWDVVPHKQVMHKVKKICEQYSGEDIISLTMNGVIKRDLTAGRINRRSRRLSRIQNS